MRVRDLDIRGLDGRRPRFIVSFVEHYDGYALAERVLYITPDGYGGNECILK